MIRKYSGSCSSTRVRRSLRLRLHSLRTLGQSSSILGLMTRLRIVVAAPPPLVTNTRTVVVNPGASVRIHILILNRP